MVFVIVSWLATFLSFGGYYFINRKNLKGYYIFMLANVCSIIFALSIQNYAQVFMFVVFIYFNIDGIKKWKSE